MTKFTISGETSYNIPYPYHQHQQPTFDTSAFVDDAQNLKGGSRPLNDSFKAPRLPDLIAAANDDDDAEDGDASTAATVNGAELAGLMPFEPETSGRGQQKSVNFEQMYV